MILSLLPFHGFGWHKSGDAFAVRQDFALPLDVTSRDEICYARALVKNLSVLCHAVFADTASNTSGRASFMKAWCAS